MVVYGGNPQPMDAEWLLVDSTSVERVETQLREPYFKSPLRLRGMANDESVVYLRAATFRDFFPGRNPEFYPLKPAESEEPVTSPE